MVKLNGAWETKGYLGPRIEIRGRKLIRLWRGSPVLETTFTKEKEEGRLRLKLKNTELRYAGSDRSYATVKECWFADGAITLVDDFPITGESTDVLYPTANSRYGNVTLMDREMLPQLAGKWVSEGTSTVLYFRGGTMEFGYEDTAMHREEIAVVRNNSDGEIRVIHRDPSRDGVGWFGPLSYRDGALHTYIPVCDAPAKKLIFHKA
ncbi:MAG: hypothetical protein IKO68_06465 [Oscillospiraceae bacterium]|nr:hypothetical protein [Oscillospiraceae bacterium]